MAQIVQVDGKIVGENMEENGERILVFLHSGNLRCLSLWWKVNCTGWHAWCPDCPTAGPRWVFKPSLATGSRSTCSQELSKRPYWSGWEEGLGKAGADVVSHPGAEGTPISPLPLAALKPISCPGVTIQHGQTTNKASGGDEIPAELFQILKDVAFKVLHSLYQQIWKSQQWPQDWKKVSFHSNPKERQCQRMYSKIALISHDSKVMLKILQARLQQYMNQEFPGV